MINIKVKIDKKETEIINEKNFKIAIENWVNILVLYMWKIWVKVTPVRTWFLRKWFKHENNWMKAKFYNDVEYWPYVNFWTKRQKANPFMENILKEAEKNIEKIFTNEFKKVLW